MSNWNWETLNTVNTIFSRLFGNVWSSNYAKGVCRWLGFNSSMLRLIFKFALLSQFNVKLVQYQFAPYTLNIHCHAIQIFTSNKKYIYLVTNIFLHHFNFHEETLV